MFYTDEIRFENEFCADVNCLGAKEVELARTFLQAIEAPFAPEEFTDVYREELESLIAKKGNKLLPGLSKLSNIFPILTFV
jgi:non-homologous end joining protein Ku